MALGRDLLHRRGGAEQSLGRIAGGETQEEEGERDDAGDDGKPAGGAAEERRQHAAMSRRPAGLASRAGQGAGVMMEG